MVPPPAERQSAGRFTITASKTFEVQHWTTQARTINGLGVGTNDGTEVEVYIVVEPWKIG